MVEEEEQEQEQERLRRVKEEESMKLSSHVKDQETWGVSIASNNLSSLRSKAETFRSRFPSVSINIEQIVLVATKKERKQIVEREREREREREITGFVKKVCFQREKKMKMISIIIVEEGKRKEKSKEQRRRIMLF